MTDPYSVAEDFTRDALREYVRNSEHRFRLPMLNAGSGPTRAAWERALPSDRTCKRLDVEILLREMATVGNPKFVHPAVRTLLLGEFSEGLPQKEIARLTGIPQRQQSGVIREAVETFFAHFFGQALEYDAA